MVTKKAKAEEQKVTFKKPPEVLLPARVAAPWLGVAPVTLRQWARRGKIRVVRTPGGRFRYPVSELRKWAKPRYQVGFKASGRRVH